MQNTFSQKVVLVLFFALCAAGLMEFYRHMVWQANEDVNGEASVKKSYSGPRR